LERCSERARRSEARPAPEMRIGFGALMVDGELIWGIDGVWKGVAWLLL